MRLIESSNDYRSSSMSIDDLLKAIDIYFGLPDPFQAENQNLQGFLIRFGASQFDYARETRHLLPRTLIIYEELWDKVVGANRVDIVSAIKSFSNLSLRNLLLLSFAFSGAAKNGLFYLHEVEKISPSIREYFALDKQGGFVNWISSKYTNFRALSRADDLPSAEYEKFRFNPLQLKPVIIPDRNPRLSSSQAYITPIPSLIHERATRGLYFALTEHFKDGNSNLFRDSFGPVFQEYVGLLFRKAVGEKNVQAEWRYGSKGFWKDTPDWFIIQNGTAVLVEVKQSGLYLNAKKWGELVQIQQDIRRNIGAGINQMWKFENDIKQGLCATPDWLSDIQITERLIVTYDRSYFLNSILKDEVLQLYPAIPKTYYCHIISVEELEYFLGIVGTNIIDALRKKRLDPEGSSMDFRDYYARKYSKDKITNSYLKSIYDNFFAELGFSS
jgi:hypothetical protein